MAKKRRKILRVPSDGQTHVPVRYTGMEQVRLEYSDNFIVQHDLEGFYLTFFQLQHPIALTAEARAKIKDAELKCVSRVFVSPMGLDAIIEALTENRKTYLSKFTVEEIEVREESAVTGELDTSESLKPEVNNG